MNIEEIYRLSVSDKPADRKKAQRQLKTLGLYKGPIDGDIGLGSVQAITKLRAEAKESKRADRAAKAAEANAKLKQKALELEIERQIGKEKERDRDAEKEGFWRSIYQAGGFATSIAVGTYFGHKLEANITAKDAEAIKAKNRALQGTVKEINATLRGAGRTKSGDLKAPIKKQLKGIVKSAHSRGLTKHTFPRGFGVAAFLIADSIALRVLAETQAADNEYARSGLHTVATGLQFTGATIPAFRDINIKSTPVNLDGQAVAKVVKAGAASGFKPPKPSAKLKVVKGLGIAGSVIALGFAAKYVYDEYQKSKKQIKIKKPATQKKTALPKQHSSLSKSIIRNKIVASAKPAATVQQNVKQRPAKKKTAAKGFVKGHYRTNQSGKKYWVKGYKLTA